MLKEGAYIARYFHGSMALEPSEEEHNSEMTLKFGRFAQLRGHWANRGQPPEPCDACQAAI